MSLQYGQQSLLPMHQCIILGADAAEEGREDGECVEVVGVGSDVCGHEGKQVEVELLAIFYEFDQGAYALEQPKGPLLHQL